MSGTAEQMARAIGAAIIIGLSTLVAVTVMTDVSYAQAVVGSIIIGVSVYIVSMIMEKAAGDDE